MSYIATLPAKIRARWDRIALDQLCEAAVRLNTDLEQTKEALDWADGNAQQAEHYQALYQDACDQLAAIGETPQSSPGITQSGELVIVRAPS